MSAPLFKNDTKVALLQERFSEVKAECQRCVRGLSTEPVSLNAPIGPSLHPKAAISDLAEYCAENLRLILDTLRQLNSEPVHLQGVTPLTHLPKPLRIIVQKYAESRYGALTDKDPLVKTQQERLCQLIVESSIHQVLIPCKDELKRCGALENHPDLQATLRKLDESFPKCHFHARCQ